MAIRRTDGPRETRTQTSRICCQRFVEFPVSTRKLVRRSVRQPTKFSRQKRCSQQKKCFQRKSLNGRNKANSTTSELSRRRGAEARGMTTHDEVSHRIPIQRFAACRGRCVALCVHNRSLIKPMRMSFNRCNWPGSPVVESTSPVVLNSLALRRQCTCICRCLEGFCCGCMNSFRSLWRSPITCSRQAEEPGSPPCHDISSF